MISKSQFSTAAKRWFQAGQNVIAEAAPLLGQGITAQNAIEVAYDLQAGSYVRIVSAPERESEQIAWGKRVAGVLTALGINSACEAGTGEATTLAHVARAAPPALHLSGFDISLSRVLYGRDYLRAKGATAELFCAEMLRIPLADSAVDAIITNHSLEPNGGQEAPLLGELLRVAARYLVLVEPDYEKGSAEQKARMARHNYVRDLARHLGKFPGRILRYEEWPFAPNPQNKASLIVFEKADAKAAPDSLQLVSPIGKFPLTPADGCLFCAREGLLYPKPFGIPVLREEAAVLCFHAEHFCGTT